MHKPMLGHRPLDVCQGNQNRGGFMVDKEVVDLTTKTEKAALLGGRAVEKQTSQLAVRWDRMLALGLAMLALFHLVARMFYAP